MQNRKIVVIVSAFLAFFSTYCSETTEKARLKLGQMNIPYSVDAFIETLSSKDQVAFNLFLKAGMDPDTLVPQYTGDTSGETVLMNIAEKGEAEAVNFLISNSNVDVNKRNGVGETALMNAAKNGHLEVVTYLLDAGADVNMKDKFGHSALTLATDNVPYAHRLQIVKNLIGHADLDNLNASLITAVSKRHSLVRSRSDLQEPILEAIQLLIDNGANVNALNGADSLSALMIATFQCDANVVRMLLTAGADVNIKDKSGRTVLNRETYWGAEEDYPDDCSETRKLLTNAIVTKN